MAWWKLAVARNSAAEAPVFVVCMIYDRYVCICDTTAVIIWSGRRWLSCRILYFRRIIYWLLLFLELCTGLHKYTITDMMLNMAAVRII